MQLQDFWDGLTPPSRRTLNTVVGGPLMKKNPEEIVAILDELFEDANQWPIESNDRRRSVGVYRVDSNTAVQAQLEAMAKEIRKLTLAKVESQPSQVCDFYGMGHPMHECQAVAADEVQQNNSRPQGQGAPDFQNQQMQQYQPPQSNQSSMEDLMKAFIIKTDERLDTHGAIIKELGTSFQNLERQVGQLAILLSERVPGTLPADTERNPKETINAVFLRSGHELEDLIAKQKDEPVERQVEIVEEQKINNIQEGEVRVDEDLKKKGNIKAQKKKKNDNSTNNETEERKYMPALPFPQKQRREKLDKQFKCFLEVFKQVHVNIPSIEVRSQMPAYAKFIKEILSKKRKVEETPVVKLTEHYSAYINLMTLSIFKKLEGEIGEISSVPMSLQLADQTTIIPKGIVKDVPVWVDKFVFHVDFIMANMEENMEAPLILGRPFLAKGSAILDIQERQLMLRVEDKRLIFNMEGEKWPLKEQIGKSEADKCGVYPKKVEKKLSAWMCVRGRVCKGDPDFDCDPG
nr:uncharacterized protein LOC104118764 [Nicotiana tomentosiformis]